jgi:hypothetical protein
MDSLSFRSTRSLRTSITFAASVNAVSMMIRSHFHTMYGRRRLDAVRPFITAPKRPRGLASSTGTPEHASCLGVESTRQRSWNIQNRNHRWGWRTRRQLPKTWNARHRNSASQSERNEPGSSTPRNCCKMHAGFRASYAIRLWPRRIPGKIEGKSIKLIIMGMNALLHSLSCL